MASSSSSSSSSTTTTTPTSHPHFPHLLSHHNTSSSSKSSSTSTLTSTSDSLSSSSSSSSSSSRLQDTDTPNSSTSESSLVGYPHYTSHPTSRSTSTSTSIPSPSTLAPTTLTMDYHTNTVACPSSIEPHRVLLLLDCQAGMLAPPPIGVPGAQAVRTSIEEVLEEARRARPPPLIVHMRNNGDVGEPDEPGTPGWELVFRPKEQQTSSGSSDPTTANLNNAVNGIERARELVIDKRKNNAFRGTPLADLVPPTAELVVVGFQTDHSIRATCQEGVKRGNEVLLIRGAHATHDRIEVLYGGGTTPASRIEGEVESELEDLGVHILDMKDLPGIFMDR